MLGTLGVSFLCSLLESVLMSTPISYITMRKEQGYRPLAAILSLNTIANTLGAAGWADRLLFCSEALGSESSRL